MTFLGLFDGAKVNECYRRKATVAPQQALALFNSRIAASQSQQLAEKFAALDDAEFVTALFEHVLCREPAEAEAVECRQFLADLAGSPAARTQLARVLLNHNDFVTIR